MRKLPFRTKHEITQQYNDGVVIICAVVDDSNPGYQPKEALVQKVKLRYEEQKLGIQRYYAAKQNQLQIERVLRVPKSVKITSQDVAITEDGRQYGIDMIQTVPGAFPPSIDITLKTIEQREEYKNALV